MKYFAIIIALALIAVGGYYLLSDTEDVSFKDDNGVEKVDDNGEVVVDGVLADILSNAKDISSVQYKVLMETPSVDMEMRYYQKGNKIRTEAGEGDDLIVTIIDADNEVYYSYITSMNLAVEMSADEVDMTTEGSPNNQAIALMGENLKKVGEEKLDGKDTVVVEYEADGETVTVWIWEDYGIPVKSTTNVEGWGEVVMTVVDVEFVDVSDDMFVLPEGVEITDIGPGMIEF